MRLSAPNIQSRITTQGIITGSFTQTQIQDMVNKLNAGSLPARLVEQPIAVKTIGPSIGADNRNKGIFPASSALSVLFSVWLIYYLAGGAIADAALLLNLLFTLAIMAMLRATFTLPGIAGTILTIGMSVDANVLIFERIREEQAERRIAENRHQKRLRKGLQRHFRLQPDNHHYGRYSLLGGLRGNKRFRNRSDARSFIEPVHGLVRYTSHFRVPARQENT